MTIGPKLAGKIEAPTDADPMAYVRDVVKDKCLRKFLFKHAEVSHVKQEINKLKTSKSSGPDFVFLDLKKAFDTVDHAVLLSKLSAYGVTDLAHGWFTSSLAWKDQYCYVEDKSSKKSLVEYGIPQGSCWVPYFHHLYE